jgi:hypothetical protein
MPQKDIQSIHLCLLQEYIIYYRLLDGLDVAFFDLFDVIFDYFLVVIPFVHLISLKPYIH